MTTSVNRQPYVYSSIGKDAHEIRVFDLYRRLSSDGLIRGRLRTIYLGPPLDEHYRLLKYKALSYTWGSPEQDRHHIVVDGKLLEVRENLYDFFGIYRKKWKKCRTLWIDAICIDQSNTHERNHQVGMMSHIYKRAQEVVIWLGRDTNVVSGGTLRWLRLQQTIYDALRKSQQRRLQRALYSSGNTKLTRRLIQSTLDEVCSRSGHHLLKQLTRFAAPEDVFTAPYFERRWVYGEMVNALKRTAYIGTIPFSEGAMMLLFHSMPQEPRDAFVHSYYLMDDASYGTTTLMEALKYFRHTQCQVVHDTVYAFLGMCDNGESFPINYDCSLVELLLGTAIFCISRPLTSNGTQAVMHEFSDLLGRLAEEWGLQDQIECSPSVRAVDTSNVLACYAADKSFILTSEIHFLDQTGLQCVSVTYSRSMDFFPFFRRYDYFDQDFNLPKYEVKALRSYFDQVFAAANATHMAKCTDKTTFSVLLLSLHEGTACYPHHRLQIVGRLHAKRESVSTMQRPAEQLGHVYGNKITCATELYGPQGLPNVHFEMKFPTHGAFHGDLIFVVSDVRSAVIILGLPGWVSYRYLRLAALDMLYDPESFAIGPVTFEEKEFWGPRERSEDHFVEQEPWVNTSTWRGTWMPPGFDLSTSDAEESDGQVSHTTTEHVCLSEPETPT
jgi:hypothetical protein